MKRKRDIISEKFKFLLKLLTNPVEFKVVFIFMCVEVFLCLFLFEGPFTSLFKDKKNHKEVTK